MKAKRRGMVLSEVLIALAIGLFISAMAIGAFRESERVKGEIIRKQDAGIYRVRLVSILEHMMLGYEEGSIQIEEGGRVLKLRKSGGGRTVSLDKLRVPKDVVLRLWEGGKGVEIVVGGEVYCVPGTSEKPT